MSNLVIGNTSQLSKYFPDDFIRISSRNIDYELLSQVKWNVVYICVGESRKFLNDIKIYDEVNFYLTLEIIEKFKNISRKIIIYSTCELWNRYSGSISLKKEFDFHNTPYLQSKYKITQHILNNKSKFENVIILYPFNFNSIERKSDFLFGKIFNSILDKKIIEIGDTYFYRDLIHPKFVVNQSITAEEDMIIGSGRLTFVNDFIRDLYKNFGMNYEDFVKENFENYKEYKFRTEYYLESRNSLYTYNQLIEDTCNDIKKYK